MPQSLGFVVIGVDGTMLHASGVSNVAHISTGVYHITFDFSVASACEVASLGHYETAGYITAYGVPPVGPNVVEVTTFNANAEVQDLTFQLLVVTEDTGSPGSPVATLSSATIDFGKVAEGNSKTLPVTMKNTGTAPLAITGTSISGDDLFSLASPTCEGATLAPGEDCTVNVTFDPIGNRAYYATLTFTDNASDSPQQVRLIGVSWTS